MANPLYNNMVNKLRKAQFSQASGTKLLTFGAIYLGQYTNYRNDPNPLIWIQWSDRNYTHGINLHYLNRQDRAWFMRTIYLLSKGGQKMTPLNMYRLLKMRRYSIVRAAYRKYFTSLLNMRLVSPGITNLHSMVYTNHRENFIHQLNRQLQPQEMRKGAQQISYSSEELQDRITQARNSYDISRKTSTQQQRPPSQTEGGATAGKAPWLKS